MMEKIEFNERFSFDINFIPKSQTLLENEKLHRIFSWIICNYFLVNKGDAKGGNAFSHEKIVLLL